MPLRMPLNQRLRRSRSALWLGVWLLLLQAFAAAEHLSALAAGATGEPPGGRLGILNICSPLPATNANADGSKSVPGGGGSQSCAICSMASASGNAICGEASLLALPSWIAAAAHAIHWKDSAAPACGHRYGAVRGPPVPFVV